MNSSRLTETHQPVPVPLRGGAVATSDPAWDEFCVAVAEELDAYFDGLKDTVRRSPGSRCCARGFVSRSRAENCCARV